MNCLEFYNGVLVGIAFCALVAAVGFGLYAISRKRSLDRQRSIRPLTKYGKL